MRTAQDVGLRLLGSSWVLGALVVLLGWRPLFTTPAAGFDPSWSLGLEMAAVEHLRFGSDLVYTYGPLGFLRAPLVANTWPAVLSAVYLVSIRLALATSVVWIARRSFNVWIAVVMAFVVICLTGTDAAVSLAFVWCAAVLVRDPPSLARRLVLFGGGFLSALELLVKLNEGLLIAGMCVVAAAAMAGRRWRNVLSFGLTLAASLVVLWLACRQGISNVDDFAVASVQVVRGYSSTMVTTGDGWPIVAALLIVAAALAAAYLAGRGLAVPRRVGLLLLVGGLGFLAWKEGFVRQDAPHMGLFFAWMLTPWIALSWRASARVPVAIFVMVALLYFAASRTNPTDRLQPIDNADAAITDLRTVLDPSRRGSVRDESLAAMRFIYALDPRTLALLEGRTVDVWPWETGLAWAYGLQWKPLPVFQAPLAYTPWLDHRDADAIESPAGPQRILRHATNPGPVTVPFAEAEPSPYGIDGRYAAYDSPAVTLAMLCHFGALRTTSRYQVLGRVPDRCGAPRLLFSAPAAYGEAVAVPRPPDPNEVVFARVHGVAPSGTEALRTLLFRASLRFVVFDDGTSYRLAPQVTGDGLLLTAPPGSDFPKPFALAPNSRTIEFRKDPALLSRENELTLDFYAMRIGGPGRRSANMVRGE